MGRSFDLMIAPNRTDGTRQSCARKPEPANAPALMNKAHGLVTRGPAKAVPTVTSPTDAYRRRPGFSLMQSAVLVVLRLLDRLDLALEVLQRLLQLNVLELLLGL